MKIQSFACNMLHENTYVVSDDTREAVIIDPGMFYDAECEAVKQYVEAEGLSVKHVLLTHAHFDHAFGTQFALDTWGLHPELSSRDEQLYAQLASQDEMFIGQPLGRKYPAPGRYFDEDDKITFGHTTLDIITTPGHSQGSVVFYSAHDHVAFTGDTLFAGSIGRTDIAGGSMFQIIQSLRQLVQLPDVTAVYPGHGPATTMARELASNPYLDR